MYKSKIPLDLKCGLDLIRVVLNGKWKFHIIYFLSQGIVRPSDLQRSIPAATRRVLNIQLNQLEQHGLISKTIFPELPPHVEYSLTNLGTSVLPLITQLGLWADSNQKLLREKILGDDEELAAGIGK